MDLNEDDERLISLILQRFGSAPRESLLRELKAIPEGSKAAHFLRNLLQTVPLFAEDRTHEKQCGVTLDDARLDELLDRADCEAVLKEMASFEHEVGHLPVDSDLRRSVNAYIQELRAAVARWEKRIR